MTLYTEHVEVKHLHIHLHHNVCKMHVSGVEAQCCVKLLDEPGSSLGVSHGCCALRRKSPNSKGLIH